MRALVDGCTGAGTEEGYRYGKRRSTTRRTNNASAALQPFARIRRRYFLRRTGQLTIYEDGAADAGLPRDCPGWNAWRVTGR